MAADKVKDCDRGREIDRDRDKQTVLLNTTFNRNI